MLDEKYLSRISQDWLWREKELRDLDKQVLQNPSPINIKLGILLIYSHWEGHFKFCASTALDFLIDAINRKQIKWTDIKDEVRLRLIFCCYRKSSISGQTQETFLSYLNALNDTRFSKVGGAKDEIILIDDNLNSARAEAICRNFGMDYSWCSLKKIVIDERILSHRNAIAHGSQKLANGDLIDLNDAEHLNSVEEGRHLIRETKNRFDNCIKNRDFVTPIWQRIQD